MKAKQSFREFPAALQTIEGYEAMHMIRKGQARWVNGADVRQQNQFIDQTVRSGGLRPVGPVLLGEFSVAVSKLQHFPESRIQLGKHRLRILREGFAKCCSLQKLRRIGTRFAH